MIHSGTDRDSSSRSGDLNRIVSPDAGFLAHLAGSMARPSAARRRADPETASAIYGAVSERFGTPWPRASVSRAI